MRQACAGRADNICTDTVISIAERAANEKGRLSNQKVMNERIKKLYILHKICNNFLRNADKMSKNETKFHNEADKLTKMFDKV